MLSLVLALLLLVAPAVDSPPVISPAQAAKHSGTRGRAGVTIAPGSTTLTALGASGCLACCRSPPPRDRRCDDSAGTDPRYARQDGGDN
jgi:hypothetical protein